MTPALWQQLDQKLRHATRLVFVTDVKIDADCLGSALSMAEYARSLGKEVRVLIPRPLSGVHLGLPYASLCTTDRQVLADPQVDVVCFFDCSQGSYAQEVLATHPHRPYVVNVDHHATNPRYGDLVIVEVGAPATCDLVHRFFESRSYTPSPDAAAVLLFGMVFDTGVFTNGLTNVRAFATASELVRRGASLRRVLSWHYGNRSVACLRIWGSAMERLTADVEARCITTCVFAEEIADSGLTEEELNGLADFLSLVSEFDTLILMREVPGDGVKVSMRSQTHDIGSVAKAMGGGGHQKAAGFTLADGRIGQTPAGAWTIDRAQERIELPHGLFSQVK